jgi:O-methyltransferase involved in polyketide biosynthesis
VEEWLNGSVSFTDCPSCGDLVGGSACCRAYEIDGETREALSAEDIARAVRLAAGLTPRVRMPRTVMAASRTVPITLVTSDSCG